MGEEVRSVDPDADGKGKRRDGCQGSIPCWVFWSRDLGGHGPRRWACIASHRLGTDVTASDHVNPPQLTRRQWRTRMNVNDNARLALPAVVRVAKSSQSWGSSGISESTVHISHAPELWEQVRYVPHRTGMGRVRSGGFLSDGNGNGVGRGPAMRLSDRLLAFVLWTLNREWRRQRGTLVGARVGPPMHGGGA